MRKYNENQLHDREITNLLVNALSIKPYSKQEFENAVFIQKDLIAINRVIRTSTGTNQEAFIKYIEDHGIQSFDGLHAKVAADDSLETKETEGKKVKLLASARFYYNDQTNQYELYLHGTYESQNIGVDKIIEQVRKSKKLSRLNEVLLMGLSSFITDKNDLFEPHRKLLQTLSNIKRSDHPEIYSELVDALQDKNILELESDSLFEEPTLKSILTLIELKKVLNTYLEKYEGSTPASKIRAVKYIMEPLLQEGSNCIDKLEAFADSYHRVPPNGLFTSREEIQRGRNTVGKTLDEVGTVVSGGIYVLARKLSSTLFGTTGFLKSTSGEALTRKVDQLLSEIPTALVPRV